MAYPDRPVVPDGPGSPTALFLRGIRLAVAEGDHVGLERAERHVQPGHHVRHLAAFEHHQTVKISGTRGAIWAGWSGALDRTLEPCYFLKVFDGERLEEVKLEKHSGEVFELREEIAQCIRMVRGEGAPAATGEDGLWSAGLCLVAEESIRRKQPLPVAEMLKW